MKIEIKRCITGKIIFSTEATSIREAVEAAVKYRVNLSWADLSGAGLSKAKLSEANLSGVNLSEANLSKANLSKANLSRANLSEANLSKANLSRANLSVANLSRANLSRAYLFGANLSEANLSGANLSKAKLSEANLSRANLSEANLSKANLSRANLSEANLACANLTTIKADFFKVLASAPNEVNGLRKAIMAGKIDGSQYSGTCACLIGTIAKVRGDNYDAMALIKPDANRPAERWFLMFKPGHTPSNHQGMEITLGWLDEWAQANATAVAKEN